MTTTLPTVRSHPAAPLVFGANVRAEWTKLRSVRSTVWTLLATVGLDFMVSNVLRPPARSRRHCERAQGRPR